MSGENKRNVRPVKVGGLVLDGKKIYIQSMLNVPSTDIEGSVKQAVELEKAGCEIVRAAKENIFSDLNNLDVYTVIDNDYSEYFGFSIE